MEDRILGSRYRIEAPIGEGGMAEVYRAFDSVLNRTVAVKVLLPQFARDAAFVDRFRREAQAAARLNHPNIVSVYDHGSDDGTQWIVMEYIEGKTLAEFLSAGRRPTPMQASEIAERIAQALAAAHAQGVVHRDIKPGNIMVTRDGTVKVMDFGIARLTTGPDTAPQTSAVLGTASYLSPEQAQGGPVDARTDIYSLGVVLYEMLTGRPPFTGDSPVAVAYKQVNETPVPPGHVNADVPPRLDAVVMRALSKNPANRYQTGDEFAEDLARVREGQEVTATPLLPPTGDATQVIARPQQTAVMPPPEEPPGSGRKVWLGVLIGVLVVALIGGGAYLIAQALVGNEEPKRVSVPPVVGLSLQEAEQDLVAAGLEVGDVTKEGSQEQPGTVLSQDPAEGATVEEGSPVDLVVAKAPATVAVPDLRGLTIAEAQERLAAEELLLGSRQEQANSDFPAGEIYDQFPAPAEEVFKGSFVDVFISTGPQLVAVPDVTCRSVGSASSELRNAGLVPVVGGTAPMNPNCPINPDRVAETDPAAGAQVEAGSTVTLFTGEPASPTTTPSP